jgi:2,5-diamino-6-(ribosylamino)-4(3H)-pyrimidinone 5'-phosphate reductase
VRVDSGGALTGVLLRQGLVDELSLLIHPTLAGGRGTRRWHGPEHLPALTLEPLAGEPLDDGLVWLRYRVSRPLAT